MSRKRQHALWAPRPAIGQIWVDGIGREFAIITSGTFEALCRQVATDGTISKADVILRLDSLKPAGRRINIRIEDLVA